MPRPKLYPDDLRDRLIDAASQQLAHTGTEGLSLRELTATQGASTNAIYSIFGGKPGLIQAVIDSAAESFDQAMSDASAGDASFDTVHALGSAHRQWALSRPALYKLMLTTAGPQPGVSDLDGGRAGALAQVVGRLHEQGTLSGDIDLGELTLALWAVVHGFVVLEINRGEPSAQGEGQVHRAQTLLLRGATVA
ncbi:TetR/AcrR family transcriptional regulator [Nigerium massiliense]|uniref:TetR/AcrR family transcriptional regulator n=1 Tax=Nigerium massiliense TaxID=1522317 RepID=UPI000694448F|nr:TetR/AcrR family transcriptional regulator [Nigerium massiliense]